VIVIGSTIAAYKMDNFEEGVAWISNAQDLIEDAARNGHEVKWFIAVEVDGRGVTPMNPLLAAMRDLDHEVWTYSMNTGASALNSDERLAHICEGRNLVTEFAMREGAEWLLHLDTDLRPDPHTFTKLFEVGWPVTGGDVPHYVLSGPVVSNRRHWMGDDGELVLGMGDDSDPYLFPVQEHWNTAGYLLVHREIFRQLRWRYDLERGLTDDPAWGADLRRFFGIQTLVRKDCIGSHDSLVPVENRGHDLKIY
jgi:hypothetical protein